MSQPAAEPPAPAGPTASALPPAPTLPPVPVPPRRRVVLADLAAERAAARRAGRTSAELTQQSPVGDALLRGLIRAQLGLALRLAAVVGVGLGGLPLFFAVAPTAAQARPFGIGLPWLLLGVAAYPFLFAVGAVYIRFAERTEAEFTDLVERPER
ncbi:MAG TPA: hypothetical protein VF163_19445 [Micromonosporaceae bacterium]